MSKISLKNILKRTFKNKSKKTKKVTKTKVTKSVKKPVKKIKKLVNTPVVAIGGINDKNYKKLLLNKGDFLAISGYIWNNKKLRPYNAVKNLK